MQNRMTHITDKWIHQDITKSNYKKMENPIKNRHFVFLSLLSHEIIGKTHLPKFHFEFQYSSLLALAAIPKNQYTACKPPS